MPTTRPRHTITETPRVEEALDELRARQGKEPIDYAELLILGAKAKARQIPDSSGEARRAREDLAGWMLSGGGPDIDLEAAEEVKHAGLIAGYDD